MNRLTREADELIRKVVARYNSLYSPAGGISQVDLDLLLDDLRLMYEKFKTIGHINVQHLEQEHKKVSMPSVSQSESKLETLAKASTESEPKTDAPPVSSQELPREPVKQEKAVADSSPIIRHELVTENEVSDEVEYQADEEVIEDSKAVISGEDHTRVKPQEQEVKQEDSANAAPPLSRNETNPGFHSNTEQAFPREESVQTIADKYKNSQKSLGEIMSSGNDDASVGSRLGHQHITDLKSVIGIAEKFSFINELFGGDPLAYEKAIVQLNGASRLTEAEAYLGTLRLNHKWPVESPAAILLTEIIRRKFGA